MFDETQTLREIFKAFDVDYSVATNTIEGTKIDPAGMNKTLAEWDVGDECRLSSIVKIDNAASVEINGAAVVVTSGVKLEDWKRIEKYAPELLKIVDAETDDVLFKVKTSCNGGGTINKNGVCFGPEAYANSEGYATITILLDPEVEDKKAAVKEMFGSALIDLNSIEKEAPDVLKDIAEKEAEIDSLITTK
jgi:hypothetical protein